MPPTHIDVRRAAVLLDRLQGCHQPLRSAELRKAWEVKDLAQDLRDADSFPSAERKAAAVLRDFGLSIEEGEWELRLVEQDPSRSPVLAVDVGEWELRTQIRRLLDLLDPEGGFIDPMVIVKHHVPRDRLSLGYGKRGEHIDGVPYRVDRMVDQRSRLLIRTAEGDRALFLDAVRSVRLVTVGADDVRDGDEDPLVIEAAPCAALVRETARGRPPTSRQLRDAGGVIAALAVIPGTEGEDGERRVSLDQLAAASGLQESRARDLLPIASLLCGLDICEDPDELHVAVYETPMAGPHLLNASEALAARLHASAVVALGGASEEMGVTIPDQGLEGWIAKLDAFLSCSSLDSAMPPAPFARNVLAAANDGDVISVALTGNTGLRELKPVGLSWIGYRWWVQGWLDGRKVRPTELALDQISGVDID